MKRPICLALAITALSLLSASIPSLGQEAGASSAVANNASLPDAPSAVRTTTCTNNNGKPCSEQLHKMIGQYPPLPESKEPQPERDPSTVHFYTYRGFNEPPLRNNKQVFRSKLFVGAHVGGAIAMIVACRTKNSGYDWENQVPAVGAIFGMDYLQFRFIGGPNAIGPPIYEMLRYSQASAK